jgi:hypothetical protein
MEHDLCNKKKQIILPKPVFLYHTSVESIKDRKGLLNILSTYPDNTLHILDNGIISIVNLDNPSDVYFYIKYICGLDFCVQIAKGYDYLIGKKQYTGILPLAGDSYHSGADWDYMIKISLDEENVILLHDWGDETEIIMNKKSFFSAYFIFSRYIFDLFCHLHPEIKLLPLFDEIEYYCIGDNRIFKDFG